jgi:hypothetical protein
MVIVPGARSAQRFVAVNCAAIPAELMKVAGFSETSIEVLKRYDWPAQRQATACRRRTRLHRHGRRPYRAQRSAA